MRTLFALALIAPSTAFAVDLSVSGACPGPMRFDMTALTPGGTYAILSASGSGSAAIPGGPCAGTRSGLSSAGLALRATGADSDGDGRQSLSPSIPAGACGLSVQVLDLTTCSLSPVRVLGGGGAGECAHLSEAFTPVGSQGQWCDGDAPVNYRNYGRMTYSDCECMANATGTQWFVGIWTDWTEGWIGEVRGSAVRTSASDWTNEVLADGASLYECTLGQVEHRREPTVSPAEMTYTDGAGRRWHYWEVRSQTVSQAMAFADDRGARIISPDQIGRPGEAGWGTPPTHWCHANAKFNDPGNCNSDVSCNYIVGYYE